MQITQDLLIGEGRQKVVYRHPENRDLCIKFPKFKAKRGYAPFFREIKYVSKFQNKLSFISSYHGVVETDLGTGYVFSMIRDFDGSISKPLDETSNTLEGLQEKISLLYATLLKNKAAVSEMRACNLLVQMTSADTYELHLIDGFGNSDFVKVCDYSRALLRKKLARKFTILCKDLKLPTDFLK